MVSNFSLQCSGVCVDNSNQQFLQLCTQSGLNVLFYFIPQSCCSRALSFFLSLDSA